MSADMLPRPETIDSPAVQEGFDAFYEGRPLAAAPCRPRGFVAGDFRLMLRWQRGWRIAAETATIADLIARAR